jgi:hypothetical protein
MDKADYSTSTSGRKAVRMNRLTTHIPAWGIIVLLIATLPAASWPQSEPEAAALPSLFSSVRVSGPLEFCAEPVPLDTPDVRERMEKELLLTLWDRPQVILWIKRSLRYLPQIEIMLRENDLPQDLKYVSVAESALRPHAGSPKGAIGFWQFMPATGRKYGLQIDAEKDERRNVLKSTEAAVTYFKDLHGIFGSWTLAAAAYNMGEEGLLAEIYAQHTKDYYSLYLPLETQRYLFRILSAKLILSNPGKYGFTYRDADLYPPVQFDPITIECFEEVPIHVIAQAANTHFKVIKDLNPEIRGHFLAAGVHDILIPRGASDGFQERFNESFTRWRTEKERRVYTVREGDNLTAIADRFNVPLPALIIWNRLAGEKYIHPGDRLIIYPPERISETD